MAEPAILPDERRSASRVVVRFPLTLDRPGGAALRVEAANISATGLLVRSAEALPVWSRHTATLPGAGARDVRIVRRDGDDYGCLFPNPLSPEELDAVLDSEEARAGFERLRVEAETPPAPPKPRGALRLWRR